MYQQPLLSIVTPTRGNFSAYWLEQLLAVKGPVELNLVYPPNAPVKQIDDPRVKIIVSPYKGEVMQRLVGLINASGTYVLALDDDDFVHPDILQLTTDYFERFPQSWVLRLRKKNINVADQDRIRKEWDPIPDVHQLGTWVRKQLDGNPSPEDDRSGLLEIPIAPLDNQFDKRLLISPYLKRGDMSGIHIENFTNKVWKTELVKQTLVDLLETTKLQGALTWIPSWNLDRLLGLFLQAEFFQKGTIIGHWMPGPEQIRYVVISQSAKKEFRLMLPADGLLVKRFPQYGYFWNLCLEQFWIAVRKMTNKMVK